MDGKLRDDRSRLQFSVQLSILYHGKRRAWFDRWREGAAYLAALSGTAVCASALNQFPKSTVVFGILVVLLSTADLVFQWSRKARDHEDLYRRFTELERAMIGMGEDKFKDKHLVEFTDRRLAIEADETDHLQSPTADGFRQRRR